MEVEIRHGLCALFGKFKFRCMLFGLTNDPSVFQRQCWWVVLISQECIVMIYSTCCIIQLKGARGSFREIV